MMDSLLAAVDAGIRIIELGRPLDDAVPRSGWSPGFSLERTATHVEDVRDDGLSVCSDRLTMGTHVGTHIDALGHVACSGELHGSVKAASEAGLRLEAPLDAGSIPPMV
ncbi:cyclase family protein, partial [Pantoea sp. SIMBA_072]